MKLYHGSLEVVQQPRIIASTHTLDYGCGFYTTTSYDQAEQWVKRKRNESRRQGYINVYDFDESLLKALLLNILSFEEPTSEWVDFVMQNRLNRAFNHTYDIVFGPVADDKVYAAFALFESGLLNKDGLISELKAYVLVDQILFHTDKALNHLFFVEAKEIAL